MTREQALAAGREVLRRRAAKPPLRRLVVAHGDAVLEADLHPSPRAEKRERRLRRLLARSVG